MLVFLDHRGPAVPNASVPRDSSAMLANCILLCRIWREVGFGHLGTWALTNAGGEDPMVLEGESLKGGLC